VTSPAYTLFAWAIENRSRIRCVLHQHRREICPIILGHSDGQEKALVWQVGGETSGGPLRRPDWKCFLLSNVEDAVLAEGSWLTGASHLSRQSCVAEVDYDANSASPYRPMFSLGRLRGSPALTG
jgi:hypothetical protein